MTFQKLSINDPDDIREMSRVATAIVREHYDPILGTTQNDYMLEKFQSVHAIEEQLGHGYHYYFIVDGERAVGFLAYLLREDCLYLSKLYLYKGERGKGYARSALNFLIEQARSAGKNAIELNVNKYNDHSIFVYEKLGFVRIRAEMNDIGSGYYMDDFVYRLEL